MIPGMFPILCTLSASVGSHTRLATVVKIWLITGTTGALLVVCDRESMLL